MQKEYSAAQKRLAKLGVNDDILTDEVRALQGEIKLLKQQNESLVEDCKAMAYVINQLVNRVGINFDVPNDSIMTHLRKTGFKPPEKRQTDKQTYNDLPF